MPETWKHPELGIIRALMWIVLVGLILVGFALFLLHWPTESGDQAVQQLARLTGSADVGGSILQRLPDLAIYLIVLAGIAFLVLAMRRGERSVLAGLVAVGCLGLAYAGGMALYIGPMVSVCGFMLVVFGGMLAWAASGPRDEEDGTEAAEQIAEMHETETTNEAGEIRAAENPALGDVSQAERNGLE